ncbi:MAG TPA: phenylalanine--tRNA ligase subunit beta [Solirubrobacteraceae bacterium]|nr:phenylalanine--tRNA ligase subunit beta [Solirubrobacteraceae bacterium]
MLVPLPWLREYCDPELDADGIAERLTMTGTNVEAIHRHGVPATGGFVVGRVLSVEQHPDADRLKVCTVDLGTDRVPPTEGEREGDGDARERARAGAGGEAHNGARPATIVCGAPNVAAGQTVAVARPGAVMPDGTRLERRKLRGVPSEGMILAESELDLSPAGEGSEGIMVLDEMLLDAELAPGTPLEQVLAIAIDVLELEITPNRPDCLGVYGVARELHAATGAELAPEPWSDDPGTPGAVAGAQVIVECPELCPRFTARVFEEVTIGPSPAWLKARLHAAGQRPINNVVDITNYVMLLSGQPLHAFDLDRVAGSRLTVRRARAGEQVQTLDAQTRTLDREMVVIDDAHGPTSIAGLMGGARSEVAPDTRRVLLEVANWSGPNIHRSSLVLGLRSEASARFEKGLAPEQCAQAQALASRLMLELCGARLQAGTIDVVEGEQQSAGWPGLAPTTIRLREARVHEILGVPVPVARQAEILAALGFATAPREDGLDVSVPALRRADVTREIDLIEEVARIDGLERLPATLPARRGAAGRLTHPQRVRRAAEDALVGRGLYEIVGWSFAEPALLDRLLLAPEHPLRRVLTLENPLSAEQSIMRPTLLGSLLDAARHNVSRGRAEIAIFESGTVYRAARHDDARDEDARHDAARDDARDDAARTLAGAAPLADEHHGLGVLLSGHTSPRAWRGERREVDFFAAKALLEELLERFHVSWSIERAESPFLHPGRSAAVHARDPRTGARGGHGTGGEGRADEVERPIALGLLGEVHPLVAEQWGLERAATFLIDLGKLAAVAPEVSSFHVFGAFPVLRQDLAVTLPDEVSAAQLLARVREAGGETLERAEVFDVYTGEQVGEGRRSLALALSFRALERTLTDEDVAPVRDRVLAAVHAIGGELRG